MTFAKSQYLNWGMFFKCVSDRIIIKRKQNAPQIVHRILSCIPQFKFKPLFVRFIPRVTYGAPTSVFLSGFFFYLRDGLRRRAGFARTLGSPKHVWHLFRSIEWYGVFDTLVLLHKAKLLTTVSQRCMTWRSNVCACANVAMISTFKLSEPSCLTSYWQPYEPVSHGVLEAYNSLDKA